MTTPERAAHPDAGEAGGSARRPRRPAVEETFEAVSATVPQGWRVELIEGDIHVVPPANGEHEEIISDISGQVRDHLRTVARYTGVGLWLPGDEPEARVVPDLVLAPKGSFHDKLEYHDPSPVMLVGEVTSKPTGEADRTKKRRGYARAGIPFYLLVDRHVKTMTLHSQPEDGQYREQHVVSLGKALTLPEPFGFDLDTAEF